MSFPYAKFALGLRMHAGERNRALLDELGWKLAALDRAEKEDS